MKVDALAKQASGRPQFDHPQVPRKDFNKRIKAESRKSAMKYRKEINEKLAIKNKNAKGKIYFDFIDRKKEGICWFKKSKLNATDIKIINRILSGHNYTNKHLARLKIVNDE